MIHRRIILIAIVFFQIAISAAQHNPFLMKDSSPVFKVGESLRYCASYSNKILSTNVGDGELSVCQDTIDGKICLKVIGAGVTRPFYSVFFPVNDVYTSFLNPNDLTPIRAMSSQREGGYRYESDFKFNWNRKRVATKGHNIKRDWYYDKVMNLGPFSYDGLSLFYNLRTADLSKIKEVGETFDVSLVLEDTVRTLHLKYLGREVRRATKELGYFKTIKFSCNFATSSDNTFQDGTEFYIWMTDDKNKIPVYIESPLQVGKVYVTLSGYSNLLYPITSKTEKPEKGK